jgi:hypothetical protein
MNLAVGRLYVERFHRDVRLDPAARECSGIDSYHLRFGLAHDSIAQREALDHEIDRRF